MLCIFLDPVQDFPVAKTFGHFGFQSLVIDAREVEKVLIKGTVVMILAGSSGQ